MLGIDTKDGKLLWSYKQEGQEVDCQCNTPLFENGILYCVAGNGNGAFKLKLSADGSEITEEWKNGRCDNLMGGFIKVNDYLYTSGYEKRQYYIVETNSGNIIDSVKFDRGSTIFADGMLYFYNEKGQVGLFSPKGPKIEQVSAFKVTKGTKAHYAHPVICGGVMYIRHGKALLAYQVGKR
jgi:outer membrane protein assembly factor BamB